MKGERFTRVEKTVGKRNAEAAWRHFWSFRWRTQKMMAIGSVLGDTLR